MFTGLLALALMAAPASVSPASVSPASVSPASVTPAPDTPAPLTAAGSRAGENAVRQAGDAFGTVVGREEIGIYNDSQVRGFSPVAAGNVRIAGLYFDPVWFPSDRISGSSTIRVGPTVFGSPFPSPTGIVDLGLRIPGETAAASVLIGADSYGSLAAEFDAALPLDDRLSIGVGGAIATERAVDRTRDNFLEGAIIAHWRPTDRFSLTPYFSLSYTPRHDAGPLYVPADDTLPPRLPRRFFTGPQWLQTRETEVNAGGIIDWAISDAWQLKAGLFRSSIDYHADFTNLFTSLRPDGSADQSIIVDPPLFFASTSGEVRLSRSFADGPRRHQLHVSLRGRAADRRFGGAQTVQLGQTSISTPTTVPQPVPVFTAQERDRVRQWTVGIGYEGRWEGVGEVSAGVQRSDYSKRIGLPGVAPVETNAKPILVNINAAVRLSAPLALYGGFVTGLEESGIAPENAANRNAAQPAIRTRQIDAGLRWSVSDKVSLIAGVFDVSKPYFNLDDQNNYRQLGTVRHRGFEASLSGTVLPKLAIAAGASLLWPRVTGEAVSAGRVGPRPVGAIGQRFEVSADWRPGFAPGVSLDTTINWRSAETATVANRANIPSRAGVDIGGRYRIKLARSSATLRLQITNLFDVEGFDLKGAGVYRPLEGRLFQGYITIDL